MTFSRRQIFAASGALTATAFAMGEALASANADDATLSEATTPKTTRIDPGPYRVYVERNARLRFKSQG